MSKSIAYIIETKKGYFKPFIAKQVSDQYDTALFVIASGEKSNDVKDAQIKLEELGDEYLVFINPVKSSESGITWLSELKDANPEVVIT